jgi:hypothetical protein
MTRAFLLLLLATALAPEPLRIELGPERAIWPEVPWPYLFQAAGGTTAIFGHVRWPPGGRQPVAITLTSSDGRKSWRAWQPGPAQGVGPITEGTAIELGDGRALLFDVHAEHVGGKRFEASFWESHDGFRTIQGPMRYTVTVPQAEPGGVDDRGERVERIYVRRSILELPGGDLVASAYNTFEGDDAPVEYLGKMAKVRSYVIRSRDGGRTWSYLATIAAGSVEQEGFAEPVLVRLARGRRAGRILALMRTGRENPIYQCESDDDGATWTAARPLRWTYSRFGRQRDVIGTDPDAIEMSDGTLVMSYGHKPDYRDHGNFLIFSVDQGQTWVQETRLSSTITMAYTGVREIAPGRLFVVYTTTDETQVTAYRKARFTTVGREVSVRPAAP